VQPFLRQHIVFAPHDLLSDAPFSQMHLVTCRNLLIYLRPEARSRVLSVLHFALRPGGLMMLGSSEALSDLDVAFEPVDPRWRIFRKHLSAVALPLLRAPVARASADRGAGPAAGLPDAIRQAYDALLGGLQLDGFLVDGQGQLLHTFGGAGALLRHPTGRTTARLFDLLDEGLREGLAACLHRASYDGLSASIERVVDGGGAAFRLQVKPLGRGEGVGDLVELRLLDAAPAAPGPFEAERRVAALEEELREARLALQQHGEERRSAEEEFQATNEELVAANEELQAVNEEVLAGNEALRKKIAEYAELSGDMQSLLASTQIGTLFLDGQLCIRKFNPAIARAFRLLPRDVGRKILDIAPAFDLPSFHQDVASVLAHGPPVEREVQVTDGAFLLLRIQPYLGVGASEGVVLTFTDITRLKSTEASLQQSERLLQRGRPRAPHAHHRRQRLGPRRRAAALPRGRRRPDADQARGLGRPRPGAAPRLPAPWAIEARHAPLRRDGGAAPPGAPSAPVRPRAEP
jgi:two-component system CheB/CheR fusion protein